MVNRSRKGEPGRGGDGGRRGGAGGDTALAGAAGERERRRRGAWHRVLDAFASAYGWPANLSHDDVLARLLALNHGQASATI